MQGGAAALAALVGGCAQTTGGAEADSFGP